MRRDFYFAEQLAVELGRRGLAVDLAAGRRSGRRLRIRPPYPRAACLVALAPALCVVLASVVALIATQLSPGVCRFLRTATAPQRVRMRHIGALPRPVAKRDALRSYRLLAADDDAGIGDEIRRWLAESGIGEAADGTEGDRDIVVLTDKTPRRWLPRRACIGAPAEPTLGFVEIVAATKPLSQRATPETIVATYEHRIRVTTRVIHVLERSSAPIGRCSATRSPGGGTSEYDEVNRAAADLATPTC